MPTILNSPFPLSVLDNTFTGVGDSAQDSFAGVINRVRTAEQLGYHRYWFSEHHGMPGASTPSPQMMLARLTAETQKIRLGAGGVMLPNHTPLIIAEQFQMLNTFAPGRIDLGLGRAPGTDAATAAALRRNHEANQSFPQQVAELLGFLEENFPEGHRYSQVHAVPGRWQAEENRIEEQAQSVCPWILGSSEYSAYLAAELGRPYAFALQFGDADVEGALNIYRSHFKPSAALEKPYSIVSASAIALADGEQARREALSGAMAMLRMFKGQSFKLLPPEEVESYRGTLQEQSIIDSYTRLTMTGTGAEVAQKIEELQARTSADEIMLVTSGHRSAVQEETLQEIARHYGGLTR